MKASRRAEIVLRRSKLLAALLISRTQRAVSPTGSVATLVQTSSGQLLVPLGDVFVGRRLGAEGGHDPHVLRAALAASAPGSSVLIVGAHVGAHAIPLLLGGRKVAVVEANPATYALLMTNARINGVEFAASVNAAAQSRPGSVKMWAGTANTGGSKVAPTVRRYEYVYDRPTVVEVPAIVLDEWAAVTSMDAPLLVVDIEGAEFDALSGMTRLLESCSGLIMEVNPTAVADSGAAPGLEALLSRFFTDAWNVADANDRFDPATVVSEVELRHGAFVSVDVQFAKR